MITFLFKNQRFPEKYQMIGTEDDPKKFQNNAFVGCFSVVITIGNTLLWKPVFPGFNNMLYVVARKDIVITFASQENERAVFRMSTRPIFDWPFITIVGAICGFLLGKG
jgi:hypothetical protein